MVQYLYVPFEEKGEAKKLGARYDPNAKMWYIPDGVDAKRFKAWEKPPMENYQSPETSFKQFLEGFGANVPSGHPIADGRWHRLHIDGDKSGVKNASYIASENNGILSGHFNNFKTGEQGHFSSRQAIHEFKSPQELEKIRLERETAQAAIYANTAQSAKKILDVAQPAQNHIYLTQKGVQAHGLYIVPDPRDVEQTGNIKVAANWQEAKQMREYFKANNQDVSVLTKGDLIIPAYNANGEVSTFQTISNNGSKIYLKGGQKTGSFLVLGNLENNKPFVVAEGYATGATIYEQLKIPTVVAFDCGNLKSVAVNLRERLPDSTIYFAADNDHITAKKNLEKGTNVYVNPGIEKATEAANAVNGFVVAPRFEERDTGSDWNDLYKSKGLIELQDQFRSTLIDIQAQKNLDLKIHKVDFQDRDLARVQDMVMARAFKQSDRLIKEYETDERTLNGRYIASDMMKEVFPEYSQSPQSRNHYNNAVHNTAAALAAKHLSNIINSPIQDGRDKIVFLTGSPGSGKTSSVLSNGNLPSDVKAIFEGQLANAHQNPATMDKIRQALDNGYKVEITAVNPKPEQALENTFKRYYDINDGRGASIVTMARIQGNTYDGLKAIHDRFGDNVNLTIVDKPLGNQSETKYIGWQHLDVLKSQGTELEIKQRLETHLTYHYSQGNIDYECFKQASGSHDKANELLSRMAGQLSVESQTHEHGREISPRSSVSGNQLGEQRNITEERGDRTLGDEASQLSKTKSGTDRTLGQSEKSVNTHSEIAEPGKVYTGNIVSVDEGVTIQKTPTGKLIVHQTQNLPGIQEQDTGSRVQIRYDAQGKGDIAAKANDLEIAKQKELDKQLGKHGKGFGLDDN